MFDTVIVSDSHLQDSTYVDLDVAGDSYFALEQVVDYILDNPNIQNLFLLGDIINVRRPHSNIISRMVEILGRLPNYINIYATQGQHDMSDPPWTTLVKNVHYMHKKELHLGKHKVLFLDYMPRTDLQNILGDIHPDVDVLCLHQLVREVINYGDAADIENRSWDLEMCDLPPQIKYAIMGDCHDHTELIQCDNGTQGIYCGSTYMCRWVEPEEKSFLVTDFSAEKLEFERVPLKSRPFVHLMIWMEKQLNTALEDLPAKVADLTKDALGRFIPEDIAAPLVVIECSNDVADAYTKLSEMRRDCKTLFHMKFIPRVTSKKAEVDISQAGDIELDSPSAGLSVLVDPDDQPELYDLCKQLLEADNDQLMSVLKAARSEHGLSDDGY